MANNINSDYEYFNLVEDKVRGTNCPVYEYTASDGVTVEFSIMSILEVVIIVELIMMLLFKD